MEASRFVAQHVKNKDKFESVSKRFPSVQLIHSSYTLKQINFCSRYFFLSSFN